MEITEEQLREEYIEIMQSEAKEEQVKWEWVKMEVLKHKSIDWWNELKEYLQDKGAYFDPKIVNGYKGDSQVVEGEFIKKEWVHQTTNGGFSGDDYAGEIFFKISPTKYLSLGYSM